MVISFLHGYMCVYGLKNVHPSRRFWSAKYAPLFHVWLSLGLTTAINKKWGHFCFLPSYWSNLDWLWHNDVVTQNRAMTCLLTHTKIILQKSVIVCFFFFFTDSSVHPVGKLNGVKVCIVRELIENVRWDWLQARLSVACNGGWLAWHPTLVHVGRSHRRLTTSTLSFV